MQQPTATLWSVNANKLFLGDGPVGRFEIDGAVGNTPASLVVHPRVESIYNGSYTPHGGYQHMPVTITAAEIAHGLATDFAYLGVFVSEEKTPTESEIDRAKAKMEAYYRSEYDKADGQWEKTHNRAAIPQVARWAAAYLNRNPGWAEIKADEWKECPACAEQIRARASKCRYCGTAITPAATATAPLAPTASASFSVVGAAKGK